MLENAKNLKSVEMFLNNNTASSEIIVPFIETSLLFVPIPRPNASLQAFACTKNKVLVCWSLVYLVYSYSRISSVFLYYYTQMKKLLHWAVIANKIGM